MTKVVDQVRESIQRHGLLERCESVVVGVSGGPDSVCLLHALYCLRREFDIKLHIAHLHHGLRGADADADAEYVRSLAADWDLPSTIERQNVTGLASENNLAFEEAARRARYGFLGRVAVEVGAQAVAVGHNADDQAETVLMHLLRGSGLAGLRGMLPRTALAHYRLFDPLPEHSALYLIRPLLETTRSEILAYNEFHDLSPRFDRSNLDTTFFRNWLRHEVFPLLEQHNPNIQQVLRRSAVVVADDYALLRSMLQEAWAGVVLEGPQKVPVDLTDLDPGPQGGRIAFDLEGWRSLPTGLQRSTIREAIHCLRRSLRNINFVHVENALLVARDGTTGDQSTLPRGLMLSVGYDRFTIADAHAEDDLPDQPLLDAGASPLTVDAPGETPLAGSTWVLHTEFVDRADLPDGWRANPNPWRAFIAAETVVGVLRLRTRRPGDRFHPLGLEGHSVKLADFLTNRKVPGHLRDRLPLLVDGEGILWVCGQRLDERARVGAETNRVLLLRFVRGGQDVPAGESQP